MIFSGHSRYQHAPDFIILLSAVFLVVFGLIMLTSASSDFGQLKFGDSYFYLKHQLIYGFGVGLIGFWLGSKIYYRRYQNLTVLFLVLALLSLVLIFTPLGVSSGGAARWLKLGPVTFQPSELLKIPFILYLASWLGNKSYRRQDFLGGFVPFLIIVGLIGTLLILQPSTSAAAIMAAVSLIIYFKSGAKLSYIVYALLLGAVAFLTISYFSPYRWERIKTFFNPEANTQSSSYQLNQARIAIGSGGLRGVGYGKSTTKIYYLPQPIDDSIFAVIAEELGFIGAVILIFMFTVFVARSFLIAGKITDDFGQLVLVGFGSLIAIQVFVHIGAISGLIPLTGVPLPFVSYGGTALAVFMTISGIMVNISKYT